MEGCTVVVSDKRQDNDGYILKQSVFVVKQTNFKDFCVCISNKKFKNGRVRRAQLIIIVLYTAVGSKNDDASIRFESS
jgi:hypothetical protein